MENKPPRKSIAPQEITVQDGHLSMKLTQVEDGWYAIVESIYEGKIFEGRVTELSDLMAGNIPALDDPEHRDEPA